MRHHYGKRSLIAMAIVGFAAAALMGVATPAQAATITGSSTVVANADPPFNMTALGDIDWAYWNTSSNPTSGAPTNQKTGATVIGSLASVGGTGLRGSTADSKADFTFTDGTSPVSGTISDVSGVFNQTLNTNNVGVSLAMTLPTASDFIVYAWLSAFNATGRLTVSLPGATSLVDTSLSATGTSPKFTWLYTLHIHADNPGDVLNLSWVVNSNTNSSSHVLIGGAAIGVPTPAALPAGFGLLTLAALRRRRA